MASLRWLGLTGEDGRSLHWFRDQHDSELLAYGEGLREDLHDLARSCVGGYVVVGGLAAEQKIADASAGEVGLVAVLAQGADDFGGVLFGGGHQHEIGDR